MSSQNSERYSDEDTRYVVELQEKPFEVPGVREHVRANAVEKAKADPENILTTDRLSFFLESAEWAVKKGKDEKPEDFQRRFELAILNRLRGEYTEKLSNATPLGVVPSYFNQSDQLAIPASFHPIDSLDLQTEFKTDRKDVFLMAVAFHEIALAMNSTPLEPDKLASLSVLERRKIQVGEETLQRVLNTNVPNNFSVPEVYEAYEMDSYKSALVKTAETVLSNYEEYSEAYKKAVELKGRSVIKDVILWQFSQDIEIDTKLAFRNSEKMAEARADALAPANAILDNMITELGIPVKGEDPNNVDTNKAYLRTKIPDAIIGDWEGAVEVKGYSAEEMRSLVLALEKWIVPENEAMVPVVDPVTREIKRDPSSGEPILVRGTSYDINNFNYDSKGELSEGPRTGLMTKVEVAGKSMDLGLDPYGIRAFIEYRNSKQIQEGFNKEGADNYPIVVRFLEDVPDGLIFRFHVIAEKLGYTDIVMQKLPFSNEDVERFGLYEMRKMRESMGEEAWAQYKSGVREKHGKLVEGVIEELSGEINQSGPDGTTTVVPSWRAYKKQE